MAPAQTAVGLVAKYKAALTAGLLAAGAIALTVMTADAPDAAVGGRWRVMYDDALLGTVSGEAIVDTLRSSARVTLTHPATGATYELESTSLRVTGRRVSIQLTGRSPAAPPEPVSLAHLPRLSVAAGATEVLARIGGVRHRSALQPLRRASLDEVTLELELDPHGNLVGDWTYRADPITQRDARGAGRVGDFRLVGADTLAAEQRGPELWARIIPTLAAVVVVEDQLEIDSTLEAPRYRYDTDYLDRHLLIVGWDLPAGPGDLRLSSLAPDTVSYQALSFDEERFTGAAYAGLFAEGEARLSDQLGSRGSPNLDEADRLVVRARFRRGALAGRYAFRINGAAAAWTLEYGDDRGSIEFVRTIAEDELGGEQEATDVFFAPELARVRVRTERELQLDTIPIVLGLNGKVIQLAGAPTLPAVRTPGDPRVYLTRSIPLRPAGAEDGDAGAGLTVARDDALFARAMTGTRIDPAVVRSRMRVIAGDSLWSDALERAAACAGHPTDDWDALPRARADVIRNLVLTEIDWAAGLVPLLALRGGSAPGPLQSTRISIGDHAAMLLHRDEFAVALAEALRSWTAGSSGVALERAETELRPALAAGRSPLGRVRVASGDSTAELGELYRQLERDSTLPPLMVRIRQRAAFREAYPAYVGALSNSVAKVAGSSDCDVKALIDLLGFGYEPITRRLLPRLMKMGSDGRWTPDREARGYVVGLRSTTEAVRQQQEWANADSDVVLAVASLASVGLAQVPVALARAAVAGLGAADAAWAIAHDLPDYWAREDEARFALGASAVLGEVRLDSARARQIPGWQVVLSVGGAGLGAVGDVAPVLRSAGARMRQAGAAANGAAGPGGRLATDLTPAELRAFGAEVVSSLEAGGPGALARLSPEGHARFAAFLDDARRTSAVAGPGALTGPQRRALDMVPELKQAAADELARASPAGRAALDPAPPVLRPGEPTGAAAALERRITSAADGIDDFELRNSTALRERPKGTAALRRAALREEVADLRLRGEILREATADAARRNTPLARSDLEWLSGQRQRLTAAERRQARDDLLRASRGEWKTLRDRLAGGTPADRLRLHKALTYRKAHVDRLLRDVIREVERTTGQRIGTRTVGSTSLTSDYDISVFGRGAELVVDRFNRRFRQRFGPESGILFDTNIYTDPVYGLYQSQVRLGGSIDGLTARQFEELRRFVYAHMAVAKHAGPDGWRQHQSLLLSGIAREHRPVVRRLLEDVGRFRDAAESRIARAVEGTAADADAANTRLRKTNDLYGETLREIHFLRGASDAFDALAAPGGRIPAVSRELAGTELGRIYERLAGDLAVPRRRARAIALLDEQRRAIGADLRLKQGEALYYASEAYLTDGAIGHVVEELQAAGGAIDARRLLGDPPAAPRLRPGEYLSSFNENRADFLRELAHSPEPRGSAAARALVAKVSKYLPRQLDAAHKAGVRLAGLDDEMLKAVVALGEARNRPGDFASMLEQLADRGLTPDVILARSRNLSDRLVVETARRSPILEFAGGLAEHHARLDQRLGRIAPSRHGPPPGTPDETLDWGPPPDATQDLIPEAHEIGQLGDPGSFRLLPSDLPPGTRLPAAPGEEVHELGEVIGRGAFATVYRSARTAGGTPQVVKVLQGEKLRRLGEDPARVAREIDEGRRLLAAKGIEQPPTRVVYGPSGPYIVQADLSADPSVIRLTAEQARDPAQFTPELQRAVVRLFKRLATGEPALIWEDSHIGNLYFRKVGDEYVAGILDQDRITRFDDWSARWSKIRSLIEETPAGRYTDEHGNVVFSPGLRSLAGSRTSKTGTRFPDAEFFMEKMFEYRGRWVDFDERTRQYRGVRIDPEIIAEEFPRFRSGENIDFDFVRQRPRVGGNASPPIRPAPDPDPLGGIIDPDGTVDMAPEMIGTWSAPAALLQAA